MISREEYIERREKLIGSLKDDSITIIFAGVGRKMSEDENFDFEVNRNFYYLTGIEQENSILLVTKENGEPTQYLFIDEKNPDVEKWLGLKLSIEEAKSISGIENILLRNSFVGKVKTLLEDSPLINIVYLDLDAELKIAASTTTMNYREAFLQEHKDFECFNVYPRIRDLRMVKSPAEIEMIRSAISTTDIGLKNVLNNLGNCRYEYNLRNIFEFYVKEDNLSGLAFHSIVAAGKNAVILHYPEAKDTIHSSDLVLLDVGARNAYYCADISRTYPISGRYSSEQKRIYQIVLDCNKATIKFMKPGLTLLQVKEFAKNYLAKECVKAGLIASEEDISTVYYHGVSHHLGIDTHDIADQARPLEPGMVITCEPGLYFKDKSIGIRIEDDILITKSGSECLSAGVIKEISDIEKYLTLK